MCSEESIHQHEKQMKIHVNDCFWEVSVICGDNSEVVMMTNKTGYGGGGWIRTIEGRAGRFTVWSLWPLGNPSVEVRNYSGQPLSVSLSSESECHFTDHSTPWQVFLKTFFQIQITFRYNPHIYQLFIFINKSALFSKKSNTSPFSPTFSLKPLLYSKKDRAKESVKNKEK